MKSPIADHKETDAVTLRKHYLSVVDSKCMHCNKDIPIATKDKNEAGKCLARMHHLLQIDRTTVRATATANPVDKLDKPLTKKEQGEIDDLIKPKS